MANGIFIQQVIPESPADLDGRYVIIFMITRALS